MTLNASVALVGRGERQLPLTKRPACGEQAKIQVATLQQNSFR